MGVSVFIACIGFFKIRAAQACKLKGDLVDNVIGRDLGLKAEACIHIIVSLLLFVEHPTSSTDHNPLA